MTRLLTRYPSPEGSRDSHEVISCLILSHNSYRLETRGNYYSFFAAEKQDKVTEVSGVFVQDCIVVNQNQQKEEITGGHPRSVLVSQHRNPTRQNCLLHF